MIVNQIVAKAKNNAIGKDNQLIWKLASDLQFFRKVTTGNYLITGRKNYESIGRALPGRVMIIVTRDPNYKAEGSVVVHSVDEAFEYLKSKKVAECYVIGGGEIYKQTLHLTDKIYLTHVNCSPDAHVFYPELNPDDWETLLAEKHTKDQKNEFDFEVTLLKRKKRI